MRASEFNSERDACDGVGSGRLWFGLLGGAVAWTVHLLSAYAIAEFGCVARFGERSYANISYVAWLELFATAATTVVAVLATGVAYRADRRLSSSSVGAALACVAERSTARAGLYTSAIFTLVILFESIPIFFYIQRC